MLYPRYVKMADGSKVLVQDRLAHAALKGVKKGESAAALAGEAEDPEKAGDDPEETELEINTIKRGPGRPRKAE